MKEITRLLLVILIVVSISGCTSRKEDYPHDFGFKMESILQKVNSFDSTYQRSFPEGDSIVKIQFSNAEIKKIYYSIINNGLDRYPDNYSPTCKYSSSISIETKLQFRINGEYKNLTSRDDCRNRLFQNRKNEKINKSIKKIEVIVASKPEVKRLSNTIILLI